MKVLLVEDSPPLRARLRSLLTEVEGVLLVAEAGNVCEALRALQQKAPDVAIVDIDLPDGTGMDILRYLHHYQLPTRAIVLTNYDTPEFRLCCQGLGASHYFVKATEFTRVPEVLVEMQMA